jgi:hypothetical protein
MPVTCNEFRRLLRDEQTLLIHFSTWMKDPNSPIFPEDLISVISNPTSYTPACATVRASDSDARFPGYIGVVLNPLSDESIRLANAFDDGTSLLEGQLYGGRPRPSVDECRVAIRGVDTQHNELRIREYSVVGVFFRQPILVPVRTPLGDLGEHRLTTDQAVKQFENIRHFTTDGASFRELVEGELRLVLPSDIYR